MAFLFVFALITAWRFEIVASPPYWDSAMGLFLEANFLADTNFDYPRLWLQEKRFVEGGSAIYLISVLPTVVAALMKTLPAPRDVFIAYHLLTFACAAGIALTMFAIVRRRSGALVAVLSAAAALTTPLLATQIDMLGMDVPMVFCALLAIGAMLEGRNFTAFGLVLVAAACKMIGAIVGAAWFAYLVVATAARYPRATAHWRRRLWLALGTSLLLVDGLVLLVVYLSTQATSQAENYEHDTTRGMAVMADLPYWCPDILSVAAVALLGTLVAAGVIAGRHRRRRELTASRRLIGLWQALVLNEPLYLFAWLIVALMVVALAVAYTIPRYLCLPLVCVYLIVGTLLGRTAWTRTLGSAALAVVIGLNLANSDGRFFPAIPTEAAVDLRTGAVLERSREYLLDHRANQLAVRYLAEHCSSRPIVAGNPLVHFLSLPRLGYVARPLSGVSVNSFTTSTFRPADTVLDDAPTDPVFVYLNNRFRQNATGEIPLPDPRDRVLFRDGFPGSPLLIYERYIPAAASDAGLRIVTTLWPVDRLHARGRYLAGLGQRQRARQMFELALRLDPTRHETRFELARLLLQDGDHARAREQLQRILADRPKETAPRKLLAEIALAERDFSAAEQQLQMVQQLAPDDVQVEELLGNVYLQSGRTELALAAFERLAARANDRAAGYLLASSVLVKSKRFDEARSRLERARQLESENPAVDLGWGDLLAQTGDFHRALDHYQRALALRPGWVAALNRLAWLLATCPSAPQRDGAQAVALAESMCRQTDHPSAGMLDTLAAAYAEAGDFATAIATATRAIDLARQHGDETAVRTYQARLALYRDQLPYHERPQ
ncbi:MAG: tetratricopeptide repeat protein [Pirellulales bacterium]|nr:tetratricopeptide repeat protein [Pirellulales bacterium]